MCCKLFRIIDADGNSIEPQILKINEEVLISDVKKGNSLKLRTMSGETFTFGKVLNSLFDEVFLVKTEKRTWIFEPV